MNLRLPNNIEHCSPDQLTKWIMLADAIKDNENENRSFVQMIEFQCQVLSIFSGQSVNKIKKGNIDDVQAAANAMLEVLGAYKSSEPLGKVTIEGKNYIFEKDFAHITTGQIIDLKLIENIAEDPCKALAICYVEEGFDYCQEDSKGRVVNPTAIRYELFKKHFPGDEFLNYFGFFLHNYEQRKWFIWTGIIHRLSKELGCNMDAITSQPYIKTLFWINYFKIIAEQENILK